jgi:uncharacterized protein (DUF169 family)
MMTVCTINWMAEVSNMKKMGDYNRYGEEIERLLLLRTSPLAVKMLVREEEIPKDAIRPRRDRGFHLSQCQAFAMSRRQRVAVAMLREDNWCWAPLIGFGLVDPQAAEKVEATKSQVKILPRFEYGKYLGIVSAPLRAASFQPDVVLVYVNAAQLRSMLLAIKYKEGSLVSSQFDPINSCVYAVVQVMSTGQYLVSVPCAGEQQRAMPGEDELIFSVPRDKMEDLVLELRQAENAKAGYAYSGFEMRPDFPRPEFYRELFGMWGLDVERSN